MQVSEQDMREAIGFELADILHRQKTILLCNEALNLLDAESHQSLRTMAEEDEKNLRMLETVINSYGIRVEPRYAAVQLSDIVGDIVANEASIPLEKLGAYILLKQNQMMCSHLVHKAVQATDPDIKIALGAFDGVYATFSRHVTELGRLMETAGVEWITGKPPITGIFGRARDAVSTVAGMVMSKIAKPADEMSILPILTMDHRKVDVLFREITENTDPQKDAGIFHQLKADLTAHSIAEEEIVYSRFMNLSDMHQLMVDAKQEHEDIRAQLDEISDILDEDREAFLDRIDDLQQLVKHHVDEEENKAFPLIKKNSSEEVLLAMSQEFMEAKKRIQENVGVDEIIASAANQDADTAAPQSGV